MLLRFNVFVSFPTFSNNYLSCRTKTALQGVSVLAEI